MRNEIARWLARPSPWWTAAALAAFVAVIFGFAPLASGDSNCGSALVPLEFCEPRLEFRLHASLVFLSVALVLLAIGFVFIELSWWRAVLCFVGVVGLPLCAYIALIGMSYDQYAADGRHCGTYLGRPRFNEAELNADREAACGAEYGEQLRIGRNALIGFVASAGAIAVAVRLGRKPQPPVWTPHPDYVST